jgi:hypothetical protein
VSGVSPTAGLRGNWFDQPGILEVPYEGMKLFSLSMIPSFAVTASRHAMSRPDLSNQGLYSLKPVDDSVFVKQDNTNT